MVEPTADADSCCICCEEIQANNDSVQVCRLACGHRFHSACVQIWLATHAECPVCRSTNTGCNHDKNDPHGIETLQAVVEHLRQELQSEKSRSNLLTNDLTATRIQLEETLGSGQTWYLLGLLSTPIVNSPLR